MKNNTDKKKWLKPSIQSLSIKETKGGFGNGGTEGFTYPSDPS